MNPINSQLPSDKKFGLMFTFVFALIACYNLKFGNYLIAVVYFVLCTSFFLVALFKSYLLRPLNKIWLKIGILMGSIVSPIVMGFIFFGIFTPIALLMRLLGRDELKLKRKNTDSFWVTREDNKIQEPFKHQF